MSFAVLFVKTSSLGDVIHNMPAVADVRRARPDLAIEWAVEEAYAPLVRLHPAVDRVVPVAIRRWRGHWRESATWAEVARLRAALRAHPYTAVIDTQGLVKSALVARLARGPRAGFDRASVREPLASFFYERTFGVPRTLHAIERCRRLAALALGLAEPPPAIEYGLVAPPASALDATAQPIVLLHGTAGAEKAWPEPHWRALAAALVASGEKIVLLHGSADEQARGARIAQGLAGARVLERMPLDAIARTIAGARAVVGVDTGLLHLAAAYARPLVGIYRASDPALTGPRGVGPIATLGGPGDDPPPDAVRAALERVRAAGAAAIVQESR